ncbi:hypothetical protein ABKV19_014369 [Rosa sericea]
MEDTNCCADDLKNRVMKVFEEATKDCEDKVLKEMFDSIGDYDSLNKFAIQMYNLLANFGQANEAKELFRPLSVPAVLPDVAVLTMVILVYAHASKTKAALKAYQHMIATGVTPTSATYNALITAFAEDSSSDSSFVGYAKKYFLEMLDKGMKPHPGCYISVFDAIACRESVDKAKEFLEQIKAKGFTPVNYLYRFEERHLTEAVKAIRLYSDLVNNTTDKDLRKVFCKWRIRGLKKEALRMFHALADDGDVDEVKDILRPTLETGVESMVVIHTSIIKAYLNAGKTKGALEAYRGMLAAGVAPNSYTYTVLIKGLTTDPNFFEDAKKCLLEMMDKGKRPNAATYTAVIEAFARQEDKAAEEEGKDLVWVMMSKGFVPNAKAMRQVLKERPTDVIRRVMNIVLSKLKG